MAASLWLSRTSETQKNGSNALGSEGEDEEPIVLQRLDGLSGIASQGLNQVPGGVAVPHNQVPPRFGKKLG